MGRIARSGSGAFCGPASGKDATHEELMKEEDAEKEKSVKNQNPRTRRPESYGKK